MQQSRGPFQEVRLNRMQPEEWICVLENVNILDADGRNLLHEAVAAGNTDAGLKLIAAGINVNLQDKNGQTPLHYAAIHQQAVLAKAILGAGGDVETRDGHGNTALWHAVFHARGQYETVSALCECDTSRVVHAKNTQGHSPLDFAEQIGDERLVKHLRR